MATAKQLRVFKFIKDYIASNEEAPTMAEIGEHFQMSSPASVHGVLKALERDRLITRVPNVSRGIRVVSETGESLRQMGRTGVSFERYLKFWQEHGNSQFVLVCDPSSESVDFQISPLVAVQAASDIGSWRFTVTEDAVTRIVSRQTGSHF